MFDHHRGTSVMYVVIIENMAVNIWVFIFRYKIMNCEAPIFDWQVEVKGVIFPGWLSELLKTLQNLPPFNKLVNVTNYGV